MFLLLSKAHELRCHQAAHNARHRAPGVIAVSILARCFSAMTARRWLGGVVHYLRS